jgi:NADPH:quinone reductase-like Zn-dependent oxidoreductase
VSKVNFRDKRLDASPDFDSNGGGTIETFGSQDDAKKRYDYVHAITSSSSVFAEYEYRDGTVLLRLSDYLTPEQAATCSGV